MQPLEQVNQILNKLQARKWNEHDPQLLISSQGKLSILTANVGSEVADALHEYEIRETHAKMKESDLYIEHRKTGDSTDGECKAMARLDSSKEWNSVNEAKYHFKKLQSVLNAMQASITAIQVTLKWQMKELNNPSQH